MEDFGCGVTVTWWSVSTHPIEAESSFFRTEVMIAGAPQDDVDWLSGSDQEKLAIKLVQAWSADMSFALDELD